MMETNTLTIEQVRLQISQETGLSTADQAVHCFDQAYVWLEHALGTDPHGLEMLPLQPGFWPWWSRNWEIVDRAFVMSRQQSGRTELIQIPGSNAFLITGSTLLMLDIWESYHDTRYVRGNQALLERSFHEYIKGVVSSKTQEAKR